MGSQALMTDSVRFHCSWGLGVGGGGPELTLEAADRCQNSAAQGSLIDVPVPKILGANSNIFFLSVSRGQLAGLFACELTVLTPKKKKIVNGMTYRTDARIYARKNSRI